MSQAEDIESRRRAAENLLNMRGGITDREAAAALAMADLAFAPAAPPPSPSPPSSPDGFGMLAPNDEQAAAMVAAPPPTQQQASPLQIAVDASPTGIGIENEFQLSGEPHFTEGTGGQSFF